MTLDMLFMFRSGPSKIFFFYIQKKSKSCVNRSSGNLSNMKEKITTKNKVAKER